MRLRVPFRVGDTVAGQLVSGAKRRFQPDRAWELTLNLGQLAAIAAASTGQALTFTCVPPGSGERIGLDRDEDGVYDRDEFDAGSDPSDPTSVPPWVPAG